MSDRLQTYREFWPYYLREHRKPTTRWFHFFGTSLAIALVVLSVVTRNPWLILGALVSGYAFAWVSHFFIEKNRPATFTYPLWSLISDFKMAAFMAVGRLGRELEKAGAHWPERTDAAEPPARKAA